MNDNIKAGSDIHAGDGGYSIGTQEQYEAFAKGRNQSLAKSRLEELMYQAGLTAQGSWDEMDAYDRQAIENFAELIVQECSKVVVNGGYRNPALGEKHPLTPPEIAQMIQEHFGVEE